MMKINALEDRTFHGNVVRQHKKDGGINKSDPVLVECYLENFYRLVCRTMKKSAGLSGCDIVTITGEKRKQRMPGYPVMSRELQETTGRR